MADKTNHQVADHVSVNPGESTHTVPDADEAYALLVEVSADIHERAFDAGWCHVELLDPAGDRLLPGVDLVRDAFRHLPSTTAIGIGLTTPGPVLARGYARFEVPLLVRPGATVRIANGSQAGDVDDLIIEAALLA